MFAIQETKSGLFVSETHLENPSKGHFFKWCETDKYRKKLFDDINSAKNMVDALHMDRKSDARYAVVELELEELCSVKVSEVKKSVRNPMSKYAIRNPETGLYIKSDMTEGELSDAKLFAMKGNAVDFLTKKSEDFSKYNSYDIVRFAVKKK